MNMFAWRDNFKLLKINNKLFHISMLTLILIALCPEGNLKAQVGSGVFSYEESGDGYFGLPVERAGDVKARADLIKSEPPNTDDLSEIMLELQSTRSEKRGADSAVAWLTSRVSGSDQIKSLGGRLSDSLKKMEAINCQDDQFGIEKNQLIFTMNQLSRLFQEPIFLDVMSQGVPCQEFKREISSKDLLSWYQSGVSKNDDQKALLDAYKILQQKYSAKESAMVNKMRTIQKGQNLTDNFIYFIAAFGILAIAVMLIISKFFSAPIQEEWVASGQITQFVTVMILLTVVTMLGLSKTVNTDTLGTLLGSVAGYVLAQGVGRQAARDARKAGT